MSRTLKFTKMHGAGNDFVMVHAPDLGDVVLDTETIAFLCDRRRGVGADGLIVIDKPGSSETQFRMVYFNADGGEAEMCGNGARCSVAFARHLNLIEDQCRFDTFSGVLEGRVFGPEDVQVSLPVWKDLELGLDLKPESDLIRAHHTCNTGVPHLVIPVDDVAAVEVVELGRKYRQNPIFAPAGTNVNFVSRQTGDDKFRLRTYERGVEDETLACGTGASATAVVMCQLGEAQSPVSLITRSGDTLHIEVDLHERKLLLRGPAVTSFRGEVLIHG